MRFDVLLAAALVLLPFGFPAPSRAADPDQVPAAPPADAAPIPPDGVSVPLVTLPALSPPEVDAEVARLRAAFAREVPQHLTPPPQSDAAWIAKAQQAIAASPYRIDRAQMIVVVNRGPAQELRIIAAQPGDLPWYVIGASKVSTGQEGRHGYYITPVGVFRHSTDILDYRAEGTFNENHIRGLGLKGSRVWDFGWQTAQAGWTATGGGTVIRLLIHATDPANLEKRIGRAASKGCVRVPATVNRFMDIHGVLDVDYEAAATYDPRYAALLPATRAPSKLAGDLLVVIDS
ncbi:L,D-transpeptidase [Rhodopila sp.]|uniref:L,D-transpeptidase n=1 Tax=Rhodopila sp. TaxID=2480087 RepID=UPI002B90BE9B|nr:L,D-transpeptidase [Rhodopila sp.]HVZ10057.1 L,D-transpeptidase [Rhodopila sp.]